MYIDIKGCDSNFEVKFSKCLVKLLVIVIIVFKRYPRIYCFMRGSCFICTCSNFWNLKKKSSKLESQYFQNVYSPCPPIVFDNKKMHDRFNKCLLCLHHDYRICVTCTGLHWCSILKKLQIQQNLVLNL